MQAKYVWFKYLLMFPKCYSNTMRTINKNFILYINVCHSNSLAGESAKPLGHSQGWCKGWVWDCVRNEMKFCNQQKSKCITASRNLKKRILKSDLLVIVLLWSFSERVLPDDEQSCDEWQKSSKSWCDMFQHRHVYLKQRGECFCWWKKSSSINKTTVIHRECWVT